MTTITFTTAKARCRELGYALKNTGDDYRLCRRGAGEAEAYYTDDLDDAVGTAEADKRHREMRQRIASEARD